MQQKVAMIVSSLLLLGLASGLDFDLQAAKGRPVTKVVNLLKDMQKQLEKEAEEDEEIYDKMVCWCQTNDKEKTKAIAEAEQSIEDLNGSIESGTAASGRLNTEIKTLEKEVAANQDALDKATAMRMKQLAEFNQEEKDALQALSALKAAITVLSKHHEFLQTDSKSEAYLGKIAEVAAGLRRAVHNNAEVLGDMISPQQRRVLTAFIKSPTDFFNAKKQPGAMAFIQAPAYAPASGQIFGILKQMRDEFDANLSQSQKEELENGTNYENLKSSKEEEITAGQQQIETKTEELAATDEKLAADKEDLEGTEESLAADQKFLANLKETCANMDAEFEMRVKARQEELTGCAKALEILTSDEAHDLFSKTLGFAQMKAQAKAGLETRSARRAKAAEVLAAAARKFNNPLLSQLAVRVKLDAFTKVKQAIDDMIADLTKQKADEVKHRDWCIDEMNTNERTTEMKNRDKDDLTAKIEDLTSTLQQLTKDIETLKAEVAEMQVQVKRAGEDREKENHEFQTTVADQKATQKLLEMALEVLKGVYDKKSASLAQVSQEPPVKFKNYSQNKSSGGVMGMIQQIINDAKAEAAEAIRDEGDAQKAYETFVKDSNKSIEEKSLEITNKGEEKAKAEADKVEASKELDAVMTDLEMLAGESADLHGECDFILKNFEIRQSGRQSEIDALNQAKQILSGAKFAEFLQTGKR